MTQSPQPITGGHRATAMVVACVAGFVSFLAALLLAGFAFDAARFAGFAPPHWQLLTVACVILPLVGVAGLAIVRATRLQRAMLVWVGALGTWVLAFYEVVIVDPRDADAFVLIRGGSLAGLAFSAALTAAAAVVLLVAGLAALRQLDTPCGRAPSNCEARLKVGSEGPR